MYVSHVVCAECLSVLTSLLKQIDSVRLSIATILERHQLAARFSTSMSVGFYAPLFAGNHGRSCISNIEQASLSSVSA